MKAHNLYKIFKWYIRAHNYIFFKTHRYTVTKENDTIGYQPQKEWTNKTTFNQEIKL